MHIVVQLASTGCPEFWSEHRIVLELPVKDEQMFVAALASRRIVGPLVWFDSFARACY